MSLDLLQDHLVSCTAQKSIFLRYSASANSKERPDNVPTFSVATRVFPTLRDFWTSTGSLRCRLRTRDPRILLTLAGLCEYASAPGRRSIISRYMKHHQPCDVTMYSKAGLSQGLVACTRVSVFGSACKSGQFPASPRGGSIIPGDAYFNI
ncbi:unnamed protein product [Heligmosomoides polygyrus]|uniref:Uncharacterized protein n=1 Tax=Heligmosomoides polygyrus TaxID=6339 RepID=A0A183FQP4_HELPZ|nr:unnamed protein product [Heligmosomoides polygyrus]